MSPTITHAEPVSPSDELDFLGNLSFGRKQFSLSFSVFSRQYSQPQLITLSKLVLDTNALHSSQISGFQRDTLRDPSPKLLFALGLIMEAIARTQGIKGLPKGIKISATKDHLWRDKQYMRNADGTPMGPLDMFATFAGLTDLGITRDKTIPVRKEKAVAKSLGKYMRLALAKADIDYVSEIISLKKKSKTIEKLVMAKPVSGAAIVQDLPALAKLANQGEEDLWGIAILPLLT